MYIASDTRYEKMKYNRCGKSGLMLPAVSLGLWHNFGDTGVYAKMEEMCFTAFDHGITHFDLANNYGPKAGSAESNFGKILKEHFMPYRDEMIISTKAGYDMWEGPYGDWGSRKYLIASIDQSLKRLGLDYVDIFYHHRMDPNTPLEETMGALSQIVASGKALYVGLSNYDGPTLEKASAILDELHVPFVINQNCYNIFDRSIEHNGLKATAEKLGKGIICFSPLAQGVTTEYSPSHLKLIIPKEQIRILVPVHNIGKIHKLKVHTADVIAALHFPCKPFDGYGIGSRIWVCRRGFGFRCGGGGIRRRGGFGSSRMRRGGVLCVFVVGSLAGCKNKCGQQRKDNR